MGRKLLQVFFKIGCINALSDFVFNEMFKYNAKISHPKIPNKFNQQNTT